MAIKRMLTQFGMGTSLRRHDYTEAASRALRDALWHNSINMAELFGFPKEAMILDVGNRGSATRQGRQNRPRRHFPYGQPTINVTHGGLDIPRPDGNPTVIANAAISVSFDMEPMP